MSELSVALMKDNATIVQKAFRLRKMRVQYYSARWTHLAVQAPIKVGARYSRIKKITLPQKQGTKRPNMAV